MGGISTQDLSRGRVVRRLIGRARYAQMRTAGRGAVPHFSGGIGRGTPSRSWDVDHLSLFCRLSEFRSPRRCPQPATTTMGVRHRSNSLGVHKNFTRGNQRIDVLKGVNLAIPQGDVVALMGPSGSGKTTLLNLLGGLDSPSGGPVEIAGTNIAALSGSQSSRWRAHHIGFVFQLYNLLRVLTAERNVDLPLLLTNLSKGEPTGDLDRKAGDEILDLLSALNQKHGKTIVVVTHDPRAAERATRTLHLEKGVLLGDAA